MRRSVLVTVLALLVLGATGLNAGTIGPVCGSCFGGTYSLELSNGVIGPTTEAWDVTYSILSFDETLYPGGSFGADYISALAAKVSSSVMSVASLSTPTGFNAPVAQSYNNGSGGCTGPSTTGAVCIDGGNILLAGLSSPVSWSYRVTIPLGSLVSDPSIKANFDPSRGQLLSEKITVPEGAAGELPIFLSGLGVILLWRKRDWLVRGV